MLCPTCAQPVQGSERFCNYCGGALAGTAPAAAGATAPAASGELRGVGGWLLLFCIWVTIFSPLMELRVLPYLRYLGDNWMLLVSLGVTVFGIVTGVQLWRVKPQALVLLRLYFGGVLTMAVLSIFLFFRATHGEMLGGIWVFGGWLRTFLFLGIWIAYFRVSKRVRNTYGANL